MSHHFSCNQYEKEFKSKRLQQWEVSREHQDRPKRYEGFTQVIATDRGHLFQDVKRGKESPWGNYVGTWDMPKHIPGNKTMNPTARSLDAQAKLRFQKEESDFVISGKMKDPKIRTPTLPMPSEAMPPAPPVEDPMRRSGAEAPGPNEERPPSIKTPSPLPMQGTPVERVSSRQRFSPAAENINLITTRRSPDAGIPAANELNAPVASPKAQSPVLIGDIMAA